MYRKVPESVSSPPGLLPHMGWANPGQIQTGLLLCVHLDRSAVSSLGIEQMLVASNSTDCKLPPSQRYWLVSQYFKQGSGRLRMVQCLSRLQSFLHISRHSVENIQDPASGTVADDS